MRTGIIALFVLLSSLLSCTVNQMFVRWSDTLKDGRGRNRNVFWTDGIQFIHVGKNNIDLYVSGLQAGNYVYFNTSVANNSNREIFLYPAHCKLLQKQKDEIVELQPVLPKELRVAQVQKSALIGVMYGVALANSSYIANSNNAAERAYYNYKNDQLAQDHAVLQQQNQNTTMTLIASMLKNHNLQPEEMYSGAILFELLGRDVDKDKPFYLVVTIDQQQYVIRGKMMSGNTYDELDTPELLRAIEF
ncbi:MAG: hypothetical protein U5R06_21515 [candidate division KSB1 bacterium]|nr:hypothetical protein [candidate division KSB1 bacterium]